MVESDKHKLIWSFAVPVLNVQLSLDPHSNPFGRSLHIRLGNQGNMISRNLHDFAQINQVAPPELWIIIVSEGAPIA